MRSGKSISPFGISFIIHHSSFILLRWLFTGACLGLVFIGCTKPVSFLMADNTPQKPTSGVETSSDPSRSNKNAPNVPKDRIVFQVPAGHHLISAVVDQEDGTRVRNLFSMQPVKNFGTMDTSGAQPTKVTLSWDGMDENKKPVPPGRYKIRGVTLPRLKAIYAYSWYNPGTPPWEGYKNSGWGGDHSGPTGIACVPKETGSLWRTVITGQVGEGGDSVFVLGQDFKKVFSYKRGWGGAHSLVYDDGCVYMNLWGQNVITRMDVLTQKPRTFQRPAGVISDIKLEGPSTFLAVGQDRFATILVPEKDKTVYKEPKLVVFEKKIGKKIAEFPVKESNPIGYDKKGRLLMATDSGMVILDDTGHATPLSLPDVAKPGSFCITSDGGMIVLDRGPDFQIKVLGPDLKLVRVIGTKGGQGTRLEFDPNAVQASTSGVAIDSDGMVWSTEPAHPRRQTIWGPDGKRVRDFVGTTQYGGSHCSLHEQDPTLAVAYGMIFKIDPSKPQDYRPWRWLTSGTKDGKPCSIDRGGGDFTRGTLFRSDVSGTMREYYIEPGVFSYSLWIKKDGDYRPCAALFKPKHWVTDEVTMSSPAFRAADPVGTVRLWSDWNEDEIMQDEECQKVPDFPKNPDPNPWVQPFLGWTFPTLSKDFTFYPNGLRLSPARFTASGAPIYQVSKPTPLKDIVDKSYGYVHEQGSHLRTIQFTSTPFVGRHVWMDKAGRITGFFKFDRHALHGSMNKPMPVDGETAGEQFDAGVADIGGEIGSILAYQGNFGQAFLFSEDGIFITSLFRDSRNSPKGYGDAVEVGADWTDVTMGQECFGGWFGRQSDGKVRYLFGRNVAHVVEVQHLEKIRRFDAGWVTISTTPSTP